MRTRNNKLINFILEFSQVLLVFLGAYSAILCAASGLELSYNKLLCTIMMLVASVLFYGLFTVLETFHRGKLYGILGITAFYAILLFRFKGEVMKGIVTIANNFLKEFMNYTGSSIELYTYKDAGSVSVTFCTTLVLILVGVYMIALISAFFYRKRRSVIFVALTLPFLFVPLVVGRTGSFSNVFIYLIVIIAVVGSRHLRTDTTDRRMRQKLSLLLVMVGLAAGGISYLLMPPERYERKENQIHELQNSVVALSRWSFEDVFTLVKSFFNDDAIDYGKIGDKREVTYSGKTLLKLSGNVCTDYSMYLKGFVGDVYENNKWTPLPKTDEYKKDWKLLKDSAVTPENWHVQLRNELGDSQRSGYLSLWKQGTLHIRNLAFGYGNYVVPYLPADSFQYNTNGRAAVADPGIDYSVPYYMYYPAILRKAVLDGNVSLARFSFWKDNEAERMRLQEFANKYYLQVPESLQPVCEEFWKYLDSRNINRTPNRGDTKKIIEAVKEYITKDTEYTLTPGKTPSGRDSVEYFLTENKKGYCVYYATAATILLRSVGIPARYVEGMYVAKVSLVKGRNGGDEIEVRDKDAHAWTEVFDEKYGFVPVEVTPGYGETGTTANNGADNNSANNSANSGSSNSAANKKDRSDQVQEKPKEATPTPVVSQTPQEDMVFDDIPRDNYPEEKTGEEGDSSGRFAVLWRILKILGIVVLVAAVIEGQRRIRKYIFARNLKHLRIKKRIRMVHHHLSVLLAHRGVVYHGQSMAEYTREISSVMEMPYDKIYDYVSLVYRARFGPDDVTEADMAVFRITYENIRRKTYENANIWKKLYYMYIMVL